MPGICCLANPSSTVEIAAGVDRMLDRMTHHDWYQLDSARCVADGIAMGRSSLGYLNRQPQPLVLDDGSAIVLDGEVFDARRYQGELERAGCRLHGDSQAELLLRGYLAQGAEFLRRIDGKFAAILWDARRRCVVVVNDRFGMKPIYYAHTAGRLLVASELKALLSDASVPRTPDTEAIATFFAFGQYLGEATSLEAVRLVPAAGLLTYHIDTDRLEVDRYHRLGESLVSGLNEVAWKDKIDTAFGEAIRRQTEGTQHLGMALSGGLDARTMLGVIDHDRVPLTSVAMGIEGCFDHRSAARLAELTNRRHHNYVLQPDFLDHFARHLDDMVHLTDGQYLSQCIVMPTLPFYREQGIHVLLRGHAGELMHMSKAYAFSLTRDALSMPDEAALERWALKHLRAYMLEAVDGPLMAGISQEDFDRIAQDRLRACLRESERMETPVQRVWHMFVTQRSRRETALSLVKFGSQVETRTPYLDNELVDLLLAAPPEMKLGETLQAEILRRHRPEFLKVPNVNTGARMGAGPVVEKFAGLRQKVFAKLGVRGYQPYERLGLWLRRELRPVVEDLLLDDRCLDRGIFAPDTVREVARQHGENQRNHTFLLMALMIFELGQRKFIDEGETAAAQLCLPEAVAT